MRRSYHLAIAGVIASALALAPALTSASGAILTVGSTSGPAVAPGDTLIGMLVGNATFVNAGNSSQNITCTKSTIWAIDVTNPPPPGKASVTVHSVTFDSCTATGITGVTGVSVTTNATTSCPWIVTIGDQTNPATLTIGPATGSGCPGVVLATIKLQTVIGSISCVYQPHGGTIPGTATVGSRLDITFRNAQFDKASGPGTCFSTGLFSAEYTFVDQSQGNGAVFVN
jgi:hypothetical protein